MAFYMENKLKAIIYTGVIRVLLFDQFCYRSALQMVKKELLAKFIEEERHDFLSSAELQDMGYKDSIWNKYKHDQIKDSLKEAGKLRYLEKKQCDVVLDRPPEEE